MFERTLIALLPLFQFVKKSEKSKATPVCIKFYIQPPLSLVVIFPYDPLLVSQPPPPGNYCTVPKCERKAR